MDPRTLGMLRRMGIRTEELRARRVVIELEGERLVFDRPVVIKTSVGGQEAFQVLGRYVREPEISEEDVQLLMEKSGKSREEVVKALKEAGGDLVEALARLTG